MLGIIYKITNKHDNKVYIGKTYGNLKRRLYEHFYESTQNRSKDRKLYRAILKYGKNSFYIEELDRFPEGTLEEKETEYILKYDSYNKGYNMTLGGDGTRYVETSDEDIIETYKKYKNVSKVSSILSICEDTVSTVLHNHKIKVLHYSVVNYRPVKSIDKHGNEKTYKTTIEAAEFLFNNNLCNTKTPRIARQSISRVASGKRKTYLGMHWEYV